MLRLNSDFSFIPLFLLFFKKFNYLPPSIRFRFASYKQELIINYFFKQFVKNGSLFKIKLLFNRICMKAWSYLFNLSKLTGQLNFFFKNIVLFVNFFKKLSGFFSQFKFIFFFFFQKLNKYIYKFSNYKRPRFSLKIQYLPKFKRMRVLLKFFYKSLIYVRKQAFRERFMGLFWDFFFFKKNLFVVKYIQNLQTFVFKKQKKLLLTA